MYITIKPWDPFTLRTERGDKLRAKNILFLYRLRCHLLLVYHGGIFAYVCIWRGTKKQLNYVLPLIKLCRKGATFANSGYKLLLDLVKIS